MRHVRAGTCSGCDAMSLPPKPKTPLSLSALAARSNANKMRSAPTSPDRDSAAKLAEASPGNIERAQSAARQDALIPVNADSERTASASTLRATTKAKAREIETRTLSTDSKRQRIRHQVETRAQMLERLTNPIISLHEASVLLRVCSATVRHYSDSGALPHVRTVGGQRRFYLRDVLALLKQQEAQRNKSKS